MRTERVAPTAFGQFMASTAGRLTRVVIGLTLVVMGYLIGDIGGWILAGIGLIPLAAGALDFCVITGLIDNVWSGREVRARGSRRAGVRTA